ncbi:germination protein YpeB [Brevibacillus dissolubilis]|uniref:germination protein YpeB n=1 Tax=Brevibacillus dissolubilis TaxID=1844116 RepID=UPI0011160151|nr:germination protein YpeB [Brevibacillus dissolubilis]
MVYGAISRVVMPIAVVGLIGAGMWGYQEHNEKNSILIKAENQYQRAFHDLNYHIDRLHDELGKTMVINTRNQITPSIANVWRLAYTAQSDVGQLPLTLMPFNNTEEFLSNVADFSHSVAIRDLSKHPLTAKEQKTLHDLYKHSKEIKKELDHVQTKVIDKQLRWMDVESAIASDDKKTDNTIIDGFRTIEKRVQEFPEVDWGVTVQSVDHKRKQRIQGLKGPRITKEQAKDIAVRFAGLQDQKNKLKIDVDSDGKGTDYTAYSVRIVDGNVDNPLSMDITKNGGRVVWFLKEKEIQEERITIEQAEANANRWLKDHGYDTMVAAESDSYDGLGVFTFVNQQNGVRIYPDSVTVKVALDTGEVNGFHAVEYLYNNKVRQIPQAKITEQKARTVLSPNLKVTEHRMAMIEGKMDGKEVLCHEFTGTFDNQTYMVYVNAQTGQEEEVVRMETEQDDEVEGMDETQEQNETT